MGKGAWANDSTKGIGISNTRIAEVCQPGTPAATGTGPGDPGIADPQTDFIARLAALVPRPRVHLTRYDGVFAPIMDVHAPRRAGKPARCLVKLQPTAPSKQKK